MTFRTSSFLLAVLLLISGCGYNQKASIPQDIKSIYVRTVINKIPVEEIFAYHPGLEMGITKAIVRRFNRDGNLQVAASEDKADAVLEIELMRFQQEGLRFSNLERVEEFRLFIVLAMQLVNTRTKEVIFEEPNFSGDAEYFVTDVRSLGREEAVNRAIDRLAKNVVDRVVEDW